MESVTQTVTQTVPKQDDDDDVFTNNVPNHTKATQEFKKKVPPPEVMEMDEMPPAAPKLFSVPSPDAGMRDMYADDESVSVEPEGVVSQFQKLFFDFFRKYGKLIGRIVLLAILIGYSVYLGFAIAHNVNKAVPLIVLTGIGVFMFVYTVVKNNFGETISKYVFDPLGNFLDKYWPCMRW